MTKKKAPDIGALKIFLKLIFYPGDTAANYRYHHITTQGQTFTISTLACFAFVNFATDRIKHFAVMVFTWLFRICFKIPDKRQAYKRFVFELTWTFMTDTHFLCARQATCCDNYSFIATIRFLTNFYIRTRIA